MNKEYIKICQNAIDFDAPMIETLSNEAGITYKEAESFISMNLEEIYSI